MENIFSPEKWVFRTIFLYVWQWESTLMIIPDGESHKYVLIDSNIIEDDNAAIDISDVLSWQIAKNELIFINTHPHKDHLKWIDKIHENLWVWEIWHSWHTPHKDNKEEYEKMKNVIDDIWEDNEYYLKWSNEKNNIHSNIEEDSKIEKRIWDVDFQVFSPAQYVIDDIEEETEETRRNRIHEQCWVIKFTYKDKSILITWDSDKKAWKEHITEYYKDVLQSDILSAAHHGSRSFFKDWEDDEDIFEEHLEKINPTYLVISAPKESEFEHPHSDALEIYERYVEKKNIYNLWDKEKSLVIDIDSTWIIKIEYLDIKGNTDNNKKESVKNTVIIWNNPPKPWLSV